MLAKPITGSCIKIGHALLAKPNCGKPQTLYIGLKVNKMK